MAKIQDVRSEETGSTLSMGETSCEKPGFQHDRISVVTNPMVQMRIVNQIAEASHENWKKEHFKLRGANAPRWKPTTDQAWAEGYREEAEKGNSPRVRVNGDKLEVNIAAFTCEELPSDRKAESIATGEVVARELRKAVVEGRPLDAKFVSSAADVVHEEWLKRNGQWAEPMQKKSFSEMVEVAQTSPSEPERKMARINLVMDIQYVTEGVKALLMEETLQSLRIAA